LGKRIAFIILIQIQQQETITQIKRKNILIINEDENIRTDEQHEIKEM